MLRSNMGMTHRSGSHFVTSSLHQQISGDSQFFWSWCVLVVGELLISLVGAEQCWAFVHRNCLHRLPGEGSIPHSKAGFLKLLRPSIPFPISGPRAVGQGEVKVSGCSTKQVPHGCIPNSYGLSRQGLVVLLPPANVSSPLSESSRKEDTQVNLVILTFLGKCAQSTALTPTSQASTSTINCRLG